MNHSSSNWRRSGRARPQAARVAAVIIAACLALPAAACSGSPSSAGAGRSSRAAGSAGSATTNSEKAIAFSRCVRARGVPNYPDPSSSAVIPKESAAQLGVSDSQLQAAMNACQHLLPDTGNIDDNPAALNRWWSQMLHFAQCMHARGVPNWPDPSPYPPDPVRPTFNLHGAGIAFHQGTQPGSIVNSPQIQARVQQCESVVHENVSGWFD